MKINFPPFGPAFTVPVPASLPGAEASAAFPADPARPSRQLAACSLYLIGGGLLVGLSPWWGGPDVGSAFCGLGMALFFVALITWDRGGRLP